ncbi:MULTISPECIES: hypothetical protein [Sphingomonas]|uniref:hypothetical protein n=1 Tax=Sphingomonas TaxID=13687 RepID=UPI00126A6C7C|nr:MULTISPECIES: hypothetical protein [Sphingomonas]
MPKISGQTLRDMPIPLPSEAELAAVLDRLAHLEAEAEPGEDELVQVDRLPLSLRHSILSAAFRGELIA